MKIKINNLSERFTSVMPQYLEERGVLTGEDGDVVNITVTGGNEIDICKNGRHTELRLGREGMIFRAITHLTEHQNEENFIYKESCPLDTCGFMYDGSQASSVLSVESCKKMLRTLASMGFNMMMLYCEDCYEVPSLHTWANMRPRYSQKDFKEIDDYAYSLGIEMIPCIQVLGHLKEAIKKLEVRKLADTHTVLMVGCDETYELIDKLIGAVAPCFRTNRIHLNMDEAWDLGLGNYIRRNGFKPQAELMREHLSRVMEIVDRHGLTPMMWSDMFFRCKFTEDRYYDENNEIEFTQEDRDSVPDKMQLVYWDYYHETDDIYERMIDLHKDLHGDCWFAASCRCGGTFGANYNTFYAKTVPAVRVCKRRGVKNAFICVWGDDHRESSPFSIINQLQTFAEHIYNNEPDEEFVAKRFEATTGESWDDFRVYDWMDCVPEYNGNNVEDTRISRRCMWQDILLGMFDYHLNGMDFSEHYRALAEKFKKCAQSSNSHSLMFEFAEKTARVLSLKAYMGLRLVKEYKANNRAELEKISEVDLPELMEYMKELRNANRNYFFSVYKPLGWEVLDIRYGGAIARIDTAIIRLKDYLEGRISVIEELEEERVEYPLDNRLNSSMVFADYYLLCSPSSL